ncbi:MAG: hypothetical protein JSR47_19650 [Proteobacteria bacterium]|nr:hypothetical protein [Pseudomonadota bacterium]MBS0550011.1 hypothetical protein [Pseudomonadota bacterium]
MSGTPRPILDAAAGNLLHMLAMFQDRPCPTPAEMRDWTGVSRRRLERWLADLELRGIVEIEREAGKGRRRMRAAGGVWTGWSRRGYGA